MRPFSLTEWFTFPEWLTFPRATIAVLALMLYTNGLWYLMGKPPERIPHGAAWMASPYVLTGDVIVGTAAIILILLYRTRHYRLLVVVYAMLLASVLAALRSLLLHGR